MPALDDFDLAILEIVQRDNTVPHRVIGERVGLSASAVRRRLAALRRRGVITADVSLVATDMLGITLIVTVTFESESPEAYDAFEAQMRGLPEVSQCYSVAGESDYVLVVHSPSLASYEVWTRDVLMSNEHLRRSDTVVVWATKKFETAVPLSRRGDEPAS